MRRLIHLFVLAAFIFSCGGQWTLLQCIAWVNMIHDYSRMVPFCEAVSMTFSGKYPCALCRAIAQKKTDESARTFAFQKYEKKFFPPMTIEPLAPAVSAMSYPAYSSSSDTRTEPPPTPPPRLVLS